MKQNYQVNVYNNFQCCSPNESPFFDCLYRRKLSTLDFKHNSQHVAAAAAASSAQQNGLSVSAIQTQQIVSSTQSMGGNATNGQVATLLPQQPQQIKSSSGGISPTIAGINASLLKNLCQL